MVLQALDDLDQQLVAAVVTMQVVDRIEAGDVHKKQTHLGLVPMRPGHAVFHPVKEKASVGQIGQQIVMRHFDELAPRAAQQPEAPAQKTREHQQQQHPSGN